MTQDTEVLTVYDLTERELAIARVAAKMAAEEAAKHAVKQMTDHFYKEVGRTFIQKFLIIVGAFAVGVGTALGWIKANP